jgi:hypothetical protein
MVYGLVALFAVIDLVDAWYSRAAYRAVRDRKDGWPL